MLTESKLKYGKTYSPFLWLRKKEKDHDAI